MTRRRHLQRLGLHALGAAALAVCVAFAIASTALADSASLRVFTRPDGRTVGTVTADWSSCNSAGDCSWQVGVVNAHLRDDKRIMCYDQPWWDLRPEVTPSAHLAWMSALQSSPGSLSLTDQNVSKPAYGPEFGPVYCLYVRAASNDYKPKLLQMVYYPMPVLDPWPDLAQILLKVFGRRWQYSTYHYTTCGAFPPSDGRTAGCYFDWRNGKAAYSGEIFVWPLDGERRGRSIYVCRIDKPPLTGACARPPGPRKDDLWGGPDVIRRRVPKALRDPGGPFATFPAQSLRRSADRKFIPVAVRCELPLDLVCRGTLRLQAGHRDRKSTLVTLGAAIIRLRGKQAKILKVRVDASGRRLLHHHSPRRVKALAIPYTKLGVTSSRSLTFTG
jgi:hypothetical protein